MASGISALGEQKIDAQSEVSMKYLAMVAKVVGEATKDEQLLQIAAAMEQA